MNISMIPKVYTVVEAPHLTIEHRGDALNPDLWAICCKGTCLSKDFEWHYEPPPSNRTPEFLDAHRFSSADEALRELGRSFDILEYHESHPFATFGESYVNLYRSQ